MMKYYGYETKYPIIDSNRFILKAKYNGGSVVFVDTGNYFGKVPLKIIGHDIGLEKIDCNPLEATDDELQIYCHRDVAIIQNAIIQLIEWFSGENLGNWSNTVASLAFNAYRHKFMNYPIYIHDNQEVLQLEHGSYRGGRVEAFFIGNPNNPPYYLLDINSMYPYHMRNYIYPTAKRAYITHPSKREFLNDLKSWLLIADVDVCVYEPAIGIVTDRLIFPVGEFRAILTSPELSYLASHGKILKVHRYAVYDFAPIFTDYVDYFYQKRLEYINNSNRCYAQFSKIMLNSLYGKFGQQIRNVKPININLPDHISYLPVLHAHDRGYDIFYRIGDQWFKESAITDGYNSFPAIASFVTAYSRMYLWDLIKIAGPKNCYYCDTDSVIVSQNGYENLSDFISTDKTLGKLSLQKKIQNLDLRGAKMYQTDENIKIKGIKNPTEWKDDYNQIQFEKSRTALSKGRPDNIIVKHITKHLSYEYKKGIVNSNGWIDPFVMSLSSETY